MTPLQITINGTALELSKYNGIVWWFPIECHHPTETFFYFFFTIVNAMQTFSLVISPLILMYQFGVLYTLGSLPLTIPLGSNLEDTYGTNYGSAYTSLMVLQMAFFAMQYAIQWRRSQEESFQPNTFVLLAAFIVLFFSLGNVLCFVEKHVLGRTWHAALLAYAQLAAWIYGLLKLVGVL